MSEYSRFFTFFQNVIVGTEENSEEESSLERALATIEATSTMESINLVITDEISNYENSTITYTENPLALEGTKNKESLDAVIQNKIQNIDGSMSNEGRPTIHVKLNSWKTVLQNLDTSVLSYPINSTIEKYLLDQGQEIFSTLQR